MQVGDVVKVVTRICDEFDNPVAARNGSLTVAVSSQTNKEVLPVFATMVRGAYVHDVQHELRSKGRYKIEVLYDEVPLNGSPIEFFCRNKPKAEAAP